jgi:hypothetical protein
MQSPLPDTFIGTNDAGRGVYKKDRPYASTVEIEQVCARRHRGAKSKRKSCHIDLTAAAVRSVSVLQTSYRAAAMRPDL